jgi:hypothetical protein
MATKKPADPGPTNEAENTPVNFSEVLRHTLGESTKGIVDLTNLDQLEQEREADKATHRVQLEKDKADDVPADTQAEPIDLAWIRTQLIEAGHNIRIGYETKGLKLLGLIIQKLDDAI